LLTGPERLKWRDAFFSAFNFFTFSELLVSLNDDLGRHSPPVAPLNTMMLDVITAYDMQGMANQLLVAALSVRSKNEELAKLARSIGAVALPPDAELESILVATNSQLNFGTWIESALQIQGRVCRVEVTLNSGATSYGTGFLIAPDLVMTNWHVVKYLIGPNPNVLEPKAEPGNVLCRFDYRAFSDGTKSNGTAFGLDADWNVFMSQNNSDGTEPSDQELDCAIIRLNRRAGDLAAGGDSVANGNPRGWINIPLVPDHFLPHTPLFIVQHPKAEPIKLALDTDAIIGMNARNNRVNYRTGTEAGSSGSPCFDQHWNLVALHHSGEPDYQPTGNEGIPMGKIRSLMHQRAIVV